ncbi:MAG: hypothetical protein WD887_01785 [Candidatus Saccharimonadales bacterium]
MSEHSPENKFIVNIDRAIHHTPEGIITESDVYTNLPPEEAREHVAELYDMPPEDVFFGGEAPTSKAGRLAVGFSKWRSSWDPHAPKSDPNLN